MTTNFASYLDAVRALKIAHRGLRAEFFQQCIIRHNMWQWSVDHGMANACFREQLALAGAYCEHDDDLPF